MADENDDEMLFKTFEILHSLVRETDALAKAIETELLLDSKPGSQTISSLADDHHRTRSFFRDLEWRINRKELSFPKVVRALGLIIREVGFFQTMMHNFFGSLTQNQPLVPIKKPVRLEALVEEVVDLFEYTAMDKGVEIRTLIHGNPTLNVDRALIHRLLVNLIDNAVKYSYSSADSSAQRYVSVDCRRHSVREDWMIAISSYGVGIDKDEIETGELFKYGTRGRLSGDRGRAGTGIGLAESKRIVEAHHGRIFIESNKTPGATFLTTVKVILPSV